jgi:hypothetical protein
MQSLKLPYVRSGCVAFGMNEYRVIYWEDVSGEFSFGTSIKSRFEDQINKLAQEGWAVKFSNITTLPQTNNERRGISVYALLEREVIPAPFRGRDNPPRLQ